MNSVLKLSALLLLIECGVLPPLSAQEHVVVRRPPAGRGLMAPNNGGIWSWGEEILVMYVNGPHKNGTRCDSHSTQEAVPGVTLDTSRSLDGGRTWAEHRTAFARHTARCGWPGPKPVALTAPLDFSDRDTILNFQRDDEGRTLLYVSTDRGRNWRGPYDNLPKFKDGVHGRTSYEVTGPRSLTAWMEVADQQGKDCFRYRSHAVTTRDGGLTWQWGADISALPDCGDGPRTLWRTHPSVARLDANTLIASFRAGSEAEKRATRTGWFDATRSTDNGATWAHLARLGESPGNNSCPTATLVVTRPDGGRRVVVLMWRRPPDRQGCERARLFARTSDDGGATWSGEITLREDAHGWDTGYPIATVRADGKIVVCYWMKTQSQDEPNYIAATIWDAASATAAPGPGAGLLEVTPGADRKNALGSLKVDLTAEGAADWLRCLGTEGQLNRPVAVRKTGVKQLIGEPEMVGGGTLRTYPDNVSTWFSWTDGAPVAVATDSRWGWWFRENDNPGAGVGIRIPVAADTTTRAATIHCGRWGSAGRLEISLSDGSAPAYTHVTPVGWSSDASYTVRYRAAGPGRQLLITWRCAGAPAKPEGNVTLHAITVREAAP